MKIIHKNLKQGLVKIQTESLDDLWYLRQVIQVGDVVKAKTERRIKAKDDQVKSGGDQRKTLTLTVEVEKAELDPQLCLRLSGVIRQGPQDIVSLGAHHTLNIDKDTLLTIIKASWSPLEIQRLQEAQKSTLRPKVLICIIDQGQATLGVLHDTRIQYHEVNANIGGKYDTTARGRQKEEFYQQVAAFATELTTRGNITAIIVAGAGFEKEHFMNHLKDKYKQLHSIAVMEHIGSNGKNGVKEVLKRSSIDKIISDATSARGARILDDILREVAKETGLGAYGVVQVEPAAQAGAVIVLIASSRFLLDQRDQLEEIVKNVNHGRGEFHLIDAESEVGAQLDGLGGVAALLRYKLN